MPRVDVQKVRRTEDELGPGHKAGQRVQAPPERPEIEEEPPKKGMQGNAPVYGLGKGQDQVDDIQRVQQGRLESGKKRRPAVNVRVPEGEIPAEHLLDGKTPPVHELRGQVLSAVGEHHIAGKKQHIEEHRSVRARSPRGPRMS